MLSIKGRRIIDPGGWPGRDKEVGKRKFISTVEFASQRNSSQVNSTEEVTISIGHILDLFLRYKVGHYMFL